jgi:hypothetical protein
MHLPGYSEEYVVNVRGLVGLNLVPDTIRFILLYCIDFLPVACECCHSCCRLRYEIGNGALSRIVFDHDSGPTRMGTGRFVIQKSCTGGNSDMVIRD